MNSEGPRAYKKWTLAYLCLVVFNSVLLFGLANFVNLELTGYLPFWRTSRSHFFTTWAWALLICSALNLQTMYWIERYGLFERNAAALKDSTQYEKLTQVRKRLFLFPIIILMTITGLILMHPWR